MIVEIILGVIALYFLCALYFGVFKKIKIFKIIGKVIIFLVLVVVLVSIFFPSFLSNII